MRKHMLLMLACCLIPIVALGAILVLGVSANSALVLGMLLLCPLLHVLMMRGMMGGHGQHADHAAETIIPSVTHSADEALPRQTDV